MDATERREKIFNDTVAELAKAGYDPIVGRDINLYDRWLGEGELVTGSGERFVYTPWLGVTILITIPTPDAKERRMWATLQYVQREPHEVFTLQVPMYNYVIGLRRLLKAARRWAQRGKRSVCPLCGYRLSLMPVDGGKAGWYYRCDDVDLEEVHKTDRSHNFKLNTFCDRDLWDRKPGPPRRMHQQRPRFPARGA